MNHELESKKEQVKNWSRIISLSLASLPLIVELRKKADNLAPRLAGEGLTNALAIYVTSYYTLSSIFWPNPLSITNHLLLILCVLLTIAQVWVSGKKLLSKTNL